MLTFSFEIKHPCTKINSRTRLYNAAALPASRPRSAGSLANTQTFKLNKTINKYSDKLQAQSSKLRRSNKHLTQGAKFRGRLIEKIRLRQLHQVINSYKEGSSTSNDGRSTHYKINAARFALHQNQRLREFNFQGQQFCYFAIFGEHSQYDSTYTYQSERHFCGCLKTQGADLSSIISPCFPLKLHRKLVQPAPGAASVLQTKRHGALELPVFLKSYPQDEKPFKNSNEGITTIFGSLT